jgi:hypothetical protein
VEHKLISWMKILFGIRFERNNWSAIGVRHMKFSTEMDRKIIYTVHVWKSGLN